MQNLEQIPLYLNIACKLVTDAGGDIGFLTGARGTTVTCGEPENQETQCMVNGQSIWIANNDDQNTTMMKSFLNKLGIKTLKELRAHVATYAPRVLPAHAGQVNANDGSPKQRLLRDIILSEMRRGSTAAQIAIPDPLDLGGVTSVDNKTYKVTSDHAPPTDSIVFVFGKYTGDRVASDDLHAEQKLLAALGKGTSSVRCDVKVFGCKSACSTCLGVLREVSETGRRSRNINLIFANHRVDGLRAEYGMDSRRTTTIRDLKVDDYF